VKPIYHPNIPAELESVRPHGDYVLVKRIPDPLTTAGGMLYLPDGSRDPKKLVPRRGLVIAVGKGDRLHCWSCFECGAFKGTTLQGPGRCDHCGAEQWNYLGEKRHEMQVNVGDHVIYWRSPANDIRLNEEDYVFLHEEQHIAAVIPQESEVKLGPLQNDTPPSKIRKASEILDKLAS
jgi:co-chaperonin GroES (HSP10)